MRKRDSDGANISDFLGTRINRIFPFYPAASSEGNSGGTVRDWLSKANASPHSASPSLFPLILRIIQALHAKSSPQQLSSTVTSFSGTYHWSPGAKAGPVLWHRGLYTWKFISSLGEEFFLHDRANFRATLLPNQWSLRIYDLTSNERSGHYLSTDTP